MCGFESHGRAAIENVPWMWEIYLILSFCGRFVCFSFSPILVFNVIATLELLYSKCYSDKLEN